MRLVTADAIILGAGIGRGTLTPNLCQICKQSGPGIVTVRGINGHYFSVHRWPCAERERLLVQEPPEITAARERAWRNMVQS